MKAVGLMSGTSLDGIDCVIANIKEENGKIKIEEIAKKTYPYEKEVILKILDAMSLDKSSSKLICSLNFELGYVFANCIQKLLDEANIKSSEIDFIASHGHTIYHNVDESNGYFFSSLQIGEGAVIANTLNITTISNFRCADIAVYGTGAPLVPYADYVLFHDDNKTRAIHNIGGISNLTLLDKNFNIDDVIGFDTGPGNMMINYATKKFYNLEYDKDGLIASKGNVINKMLDELLDNDYFKMVPPKSTGREMFGDEYTEYIINKYKLEKKEDIIKTLTLFTAKTISNAYLDFIISDHDLKEIIFCGGGAYNKYLIKLIQKELPKIKISLLDDYGYDSSFKEAIAFIILGYLTIHKRPSNCMATTGAKKRVIQGQINEVIK
ncbi:anhydro-N-acetylmuramic acid kinase [Acholeplasma sp. OttesenSCG-928-E16]|nr:anhydro-N-acetylmuramic acid kinase [Acholeplasma sp. OttesenSCG-928-E16]